MDSPDRKNGQDKETHKTEPVAHGVITDWVVGRRFHSRVKLAGTDTVTVQREASNPHDPNAFAVYKKRSVAGYLPAAVAAYLAPLFDKQLISFEATLLGGDTPDGCAPLSLNVTLKDVKALGAAAVTDKGPDPAFSNLFAAWRDRGEYDLATLKKFCADGEKVFGSYSAPSKLIHRLLSDYCARQAGKQASADEKEQAALAARRKMISDFLKVEGYVPDLTDDKMVHFKYEGGNYFIATDDPDPQFFSIVYPKFWAIESSEEYEAALRAGRKATERTKVAKVFPIENDTWASIEIFIPDIEDVKPVFQRLLRALKSAVETFKAEMRAWMDARKKHG